ncbi:winged helix-turn-helix transcriptional regulator [uncultured Roseibium sp.]|uniref:winged helix-turn-helix transcriptional regulator n=1 Tax=uncultured Roseibium sp. TaxID=1936171 RepID=UPI002624F14B|nr:winged helix-turn-helix transcriptional regulator [uncultured Roseibium sp.]
MDITLLVKLTSKAWSLKILALMHAGTPGRQAPLIAATSASRSAFASSLDHLVQLGLLEKNPGHGHPLRPEFRLTALGVPVAAVASKVIGTAPDETALAIIRRNWAVPILAITAKPTRFSIIKSELGSITDRALSKSLCTLEDQQWLEREIDVSQRAPFPTYLAVNAGLQINKAISLSP